MLYRTLCTAIIVLATSTVCHAERGGLVRQSCPKKFNNKMLSQLANTLDPQTGKSTPMRIPLYGRHSQFALNLGKETGALEDLKRPEEKRNFNVATDRVHLLTSGGEEILSARQDLCKYRVTDQHDNLKYVVNIIVTH